MKNYNYKKKTLKLIEMLSSEEFKSKKLSQREIQRTLDLHIEVVRYHYYKLYFPDKFKARYRRYSYPQKSIDLN